MIAFVTTRSGAQYAFKHDPLTWERIHGTQDIIGASSIRGATRGSLIEWPAIIAGQGIMFDDKILGTIYTTPVVAVKVVYE